MNEYLTWQFGQFCLACSIVGMVGGTTVYQIEKSYTEPQPYKANMVRASTYTGKGQFKCQTGC